MHSFTFTIGAMLTAAVAVGAVTLDARHGGPGNDNQNHGGSGSSSCASNEFWYSKKSCCLPSGETGKPTPPPSTDCPKNWYWRAASNACVPSHPDYDSDTPSCPKSTYGWNKGSQCCKPHSTPSGHYSRRAKRALATSLCPTGLNACPVSGAVPHGDYECLDTASELESCGGCASTGEGENCAAITGAWNFACERGTCVVYSCDAGLKVGSDGKSCIPLA